MADRDQEIEDAERRGEVTATLKNIEKHLDKLNGYDARLRNLEMRVYAIGIIVAAILKATGS